MADGPIATQRTMVRGAAASRTKSLWPAIFFASLFVAGLAVAVPIYRSYLRQPLSPNLQARVDALSGLTDEQLIARLRISAARTLEDLSDDELEDLLAVFEAHHQRLIGTFRMQAAANDPEDRTLAYRQLVAVLRDPITALTYCSAKARCHHETAGDDDYREMAKLELEWDRDTQRKATAGDAIGAIALQAPGYGALFVVGCLLLTIRRWLPKVVRFAAECAKSARRAITMTPRQHKIIWAGIACLGLLTLWVPWTAAGNSRYGGAASYGWIFSPPRNDVVIDTVRLLVPMALVALATAAAVFMTGQKGGKQT